jgi:hypothetical protein
VVNPLAAWLSLILLLAGPAGALVINPTFTDGAGQTWNSDPARKAVIDRAIADWDSSLFDKQTVNVDFIFTHAGANSYLAEWFGSGSFAAGANIYPWTPGAVHTVAFNVDFFNSANSLWFDPTPATGGDLPAKSWDALTVTRHELCHMMGFSSAYYVDNFSQAGEHDRWTDHIVGTTFDPNGINVQLAGANNLSHLADSGPTKGDLMAPALANGVRRPISQTDLSMLALAHNYQLATPGDFNLDGRVDGHDFLTWQQNYPTLSGATLAQGDANGDGIVNGKDFLIWQQHYQPLAGTIVPEPAALALLLLAAVRRLRPRR